MIDYRIKNINKKLKIIKMCSAHLANVVANWAEMEFAALRLITFITLAGIN